MSYRRQALGSAFPLFHLPRPLVLSQTAGRRLFVSLPLTPSGNNCGYCIKSRSPSAAFRVFCCAEKICCPGSQGWHRQRRGGGVSVAPRAQQAGSWECGEEAMLEKIVVRFLFTVYSKPESSAGRWAAVHCFRVSHKMPIFKLLIKS